MRRGRGVLLEEGGGGLKRRVGEGGGCTQFVNIRSRMIIDPLIPNMPGRGTSGFPQPGRRPGGAGGFTTVLGRIHA